MWLAELSRLVYRHDIEEDTRPPYPGRIHFLRQAGLEQRAFTHLGKNQYEGDACPVRDAARIRGAGVPRHPAKLQGRQDRPGMRNSAVGHG